MTIQNNPPKDHGFYAPIPRIIRTGYKNLTPAQKWVYVCLRDVCGEHGTCFRSLRTLSEETGLSTGMLSESIRALHDVGLVHAEKKRRSEKPTAKEVWHISIVDIWQANASKHPTSRGVPAKRSQNEQPSDNVHNVNNNVHNVNVAHAQKRSQNEQQCSQNETEVISLEEVSLHEEISGEEEKVETPSSSEHIQHVQDEPTKPDLLSMKRGSFLPSHSKTFHKQESKKQLRLLSTRPSKDEVKPPTRRELEQQEEQAIKRYWELAEKHLKRPFPQYFRERPINENGLRELLQSGETLERIELGLQRLDTRESGKFNWTWFLEWLPNKFGEAYEPDKKENGNAGSSATIGDYVLFSSIGR